jgi:hypothetical protein
MKIQGREKYRLQRILLIVALLSLIGAIAMLISAEYNATCFFSAVSIVLIVVAMKYVMYLYRKLSGKLTNEEIDEQKELDKYKIITSAFRINENERKLLINYHVYDYEIISKYEIESNEFTVTENKIYKKGGMPGIVVGGKISEHLGVGVVLGGKKKIEVKTKEKVFCDLLRIKVFLKDPEQQVEYLTFIKKKTYENSFSFARAVKSTKACGAVFESIVNSKN